MSHIRIRLQAFTAILVAFAAIAVSSCSTPKNIVYFQDIDGQMSYTGTKQIIKLKPNDNISIVVTSSDPEVSNMFNLPYSPRYLGSVLRNETTNYGVVTYTVDQDGNIDFPYLGQIKVDGMTRFELADLIHSKLVSTDLVKDPVVIVDINNAKVSVIGEVSRPGTYSIDTDDMTILDALSAAGDLTIYGKREQIKVLRSTPSGQQTYLVSLLDAEALRQSPVYFVQQDDVIYVDPNNTRIRQSTSNGNTFQSSSFYISLASMLITLLAVTVFK